MSIAAGVLRFADWDVRTGGGKPFFLILIGVVPIAIWAIFADEPPANGPVWAMVAVWTFFAACAALGLWRTVRYAIDRHRTLKAMEELEAGERGNG